MHLVDPSLEFDFHLETSDHFLKIQAKYSSNSTVSFFKSKKDKDNHYSSTYYASTDFEFALIHHDTDCNTWFALVSAEYLTANNYIGKNAKKIYLNYSAVLEDAKKDMGVYSVSHSVFQLVTQLKDIILKKRSKGMESMKIQPLNKHLTQLLPHDFI